MGDVVFKEPLACQMLSAVYQLIKWTHYRSSIAINNKFVSFSRYYQLDEDNINFDNIIKNDNNNDFSLCFGESYVDHENILRGKGKC
jgi:hypothetical protein